MIEGRPAIRLMTWNIHGGIGRDGRRDIARVQRAIAAEAPDIAAFQEVDSRSQRGGSTDVHAALRAQVGDHGHEAWSITGPDGAYGQMLASRFPLREPRVHDLSVSGREPRKAIEAHVALPEGEIRIIATHLGLHRAERRSQASRLRKIVNADLETPLVLMGDLNDWGLRGPVWAALSRVFDDTDRIATFPTRFPVFALDRILARPAGLIARRWAPASTKPASDHCAVVAELSTNRDTVE